MATPPTPTVRLRLVGVGAMNSPRYRPAGLLVSWRGHRVLLDAGGDAAGDEPLGGWLVCDERAELMPQIRRTARALGLTVAATDYRAGGVEIVPLPVSHTSHPTYGYLIRTEQARAVWAPEFWTFPEWAAGADLMFADAAGWNRPIRFAGGVGGHAAVLQVAQDARDRQVGRLVFAHIGRPSIRAIDRGEQPPFGEWGVEGRTYRL
ncbi:MBL fold metallo-hydrolase [Nonomuraea sp. M3C6]|uniref:MBL fold metallo-hydrolase n=1 Tax=Nonomuraea marmarensis TaxID=3351344 RepID=A0ABW7AAZ8_9ACTN